ncbi:Conserved_hypothetical protein [Hexamita inflata]|uniref:Transmembrane protein n=1 Tax=Hexamita inflata TaxID=28002 RepID=A0ABP1HF68_9EUKA
MQTFPDILDNLIYMPDCYSLESEATIFPSNLSLCFQLKSQNNLNCQKFPAGIKVIAQLNQFDSLAVPYLPYSYVYNFNYLTTQQVCIQCLDQKCIDLEFQLSTKVKLLIESTSRYTEVVCGKVNRVQENRSSCFHQDRINKLDFESKVVIKQNQVCYWAAINDECPMMNSLDIVNATIQIQFNDTTQYYVYKQSNAQSSFNLIPQVGTNGYYEFCFQDSKSLSIIAKRIPLLGTIQINVKQRGLSMKMTSQTKRVNIEQATDGFDSLTAFVQVVEIQTYGIVSVAEAAKYNQIIQQLAKPMYFSYIEVFSKTTNLSFKAYSGEYFTFANNSILYFARYKNPNLPAQIADILNKEDLSDLVIYINNFVRDQNDNVILAYRKKFTVIKVTCWSAVEAIWNSNVNLTVKITPNLNQKFCTSIIPRNVVAVVGFINNSINIAYPGFVLNVKDYVVNQTEFVLTTTNESMKNQIETAEYNQFFLYSENGDIIENTEMNVWVKLKVRQNKYLMQVLGACMGGTAVWAIVYYLVGVAVKQINGLKRIKPVKQIVYDEE